MSARDNSSHRENFVLSFEDVGNELKNACAVVTVQACKIIRELLSVTS